MKACLNCLAALLMAATVSPLAYAASTAFHYQGALLDAGGIPANGDYDFEFTLFDAETGGMTVGTTVSTTATVDDGLFELSLDFGDAVWDGTDLWLEIAAGETGQALATLSPRQPVQPVPLAISADLLDGMDSSAFLTAEADGDTSNELQDHFATVAADSGSTTTDAQNDALAIVGGSDVTTAIAGDTLTVSTTATTDNLGDHTATQDIDLGTFALVGNGSTQGITMASDGDLTVAGVLIIDGVGETITSSTGTIDFADDNVTTTGALAAGGATVSGLDCSSNAAGGTLTAAATGVVACSDDDDDSRNTLDGAYDEGGAGVGRTITADSGAVRIEGSGGLVVDGGSVEQTPLNPTLVASLDVLPSPDDIAVAWPYAYVVDNVLDQMVVFDVTDPSKPEQLGTLDGLGQPTNVAVAGHYVYVTEDSSDELLVVDVSNATAPVIAGSLAIGSLSQSLHVAGRYAYVLDAGSTGLQVVDISDPSAPSLTTTLTSTNSGNIDAALQGSFWYSVGTTGSGLLVVDISDPTSPSLTGSLVLGSRPGDIAVLGRYAYVLDENDDTLTIVDIADPSLPVVASTLSGFPRGQDIQIAGDYAYIADFNLDGIAVVDISDAANPVQVGLYDQLNSPNALRIGGRYAYVVDSTADGFSILDISGASATSVIAHSMEAGTMAVHDDASIRGSLSATTGMTVGSGGIFADGDVGVRGSIALAIDVAPTTSPANLAQLYAEDVSGSAELRVRDEAGNVTTRSPHNFSLLGEPSEPMAWSYYSENANGRINVDMLKAVRTVERLSGKQLVFQRDVAGNPLPASVNSDDSLWGQIRRAKMHNEQLRSTQSELLDRLQRLERLLDQLQLGGGQ